MQVQTDSPLFSKQEMKIQIAAKGENVSGDDKYTSASQLQNRVKREDEIDETKKQLPIPITDTDKECVGQYMDTLVPPITFRLPSATIPSDYDHVVILGRNCILQTCFDWSEASPCVTFHEFDIENMEENLTSLRVLQLGFPKKTLWLFFGDIRFVCRDSALSDEKTSQCAIYALPECKLPQNQPLEVIATVFPQSNDHEGIVSVVSPLIDRFEKALSKFTSNLPMESDVFLADIAPSNISFVKTGVYDHANSHMLRTKDILHRICSGPENINDIVMVLRDKWSDLCKRTRISRRLANIVTENYALLKHTITVDTTHQGETHHHSRQRAAWLKMIWNVINSAIGNKDQGWFLYIFAVSNIPIFHPEI